VIARLQKENQDLNHRLTNSDTRVEELNNRLSQQQQQQQQVVVEQPQVAINPEPVAFVKDDEPMKEEERKIDEQPIGLSAELVNKFESLSEKLI